MRKKYEEEEEEEEEELKGFVGWEEYIECPDRGKRVVHYYLHLSTGESVLAVVGTERSLRHMTYTLTHPFVSQYGSLCQVTPTTKWRARRDVLHWLSSLLSSSGKSDYSLVQPAYAQTWGSRGHLFSRLPEMLRRKLKTQNSHILWNGVSWACSKQLMHYHSFRRNGVDIRVHSFVFIMASEGNHYVGYIEDMYEDKKSQKKVKVRWFHREEELPGLIPQLNVHSREVFITPQVQVISAECIDGPASVLTPKHYEECMAVLPHSILCGVHMCFRQLRNDMITPFSISKLQGYSGQPILSSINPPLFLKNNTEAYREDRPDNSTLRDIKHGHKRKRLEGKKEGTSYGMNHLWLGRNHNKLCQSETSPSALKTEKVVPPYPKLKIKLSGRILKRGNQLEPLTSFKINDEIELLCQDSGIRGCWFRCKVLQVSRKHVKVEYDDLQDAEKPGNLQEWVTLCKVAAPDKLGMRCSGRLTTRPRPPEDSGECSLEVGAPVDVWWHDGWWEGVVITTNEFGTDHLQIYLPGEDRLVKIEKGCVRNAKDWVNGSWFDAKMKPDILSCISVKANEIITDSDLASILETVKVKKSGQAAHNLTLEKKSHKAEIFDAEVDKQSLELFNVSRSGKMLG